MYSKGMLQTEEYWTAYETQRAADFRRHAEVPEMQVFHVTQHTGVCKDLQHEFVSQCKVKASLLVAVTGRPYKRDSAAETWNWKYKPP